MQARTSQKPWIFPTPAARDPLVPGKYQEHLPESCRCYMASSGFNAPLHLQTAARALSREVTTNYIDLKENERKRQNQYMTDSALYLTT
jgi:hypothetical protein